MCYGAARNLASCLDVHVSSRNREKEHRETYTMGSDGIWRLSRAGVHRGRNMAVRSSIGRPHVRGCWRVSIGHSGWRWTSTKQLLLSLKAALLGSKGGISGTDQRVFDRSHKLWREDGLCGN